jgi:hypothetical protein
MVDGGMWRPARCDAPKAQLGLIAVPLRDDFDIHRPGQASVIVNNDATMSSRATASPISSPRLGRLAVATIPRATLIVTREFHAMPDRHQLAPSPLVRP